MVFEDGLYLYTALILYTMKLLYTILFFADVLVMIILSFVFFDMVDNNAPAANIVLMVLGLAITIFALIFFFRKYLKASRREQNSYFEVH